MPNGKLFMWKAMRKETFNLGHCKTFSIVYNIDLFQAMNKLVSNFCEDTWHHIRRAWQKVWYGFSWLLFGWVCLLVIKQGIKGRVVAERFESYPLLQRSSTILSDFLFSLVIRLTTLNAKKIGNVILMLCIISFFS